MEFMKALSKVRSSDSPTSSCTNNSADFYTITDDEDKSTLTDYKTLSLCSASSIDLNSNDHQKRKCTMCTRSFDTLQECMRHEILDHPNGEKSTHKPMRTTLSRLLPVFEKSEQEYNQQHIQELFRKCQPGMELYELFQIYCVSFERANEIVSLVKRCLHIELRSIQRVLVNTYGSCENGLMLWDSDIDIYVTAPNPEQRFRQGWRPNDARHQNTYRFNNRWVRQIYNRLNTCLRRGSHFDEIIAIRRARVPIIKCRHIKTGLRVDINTSSPNSSINTDILRELVLFDVRIHNFMRFMKIWAKKLCIAGRNRMTSYCFCTLLLFYLQQSHNVYLRPLIPPIEQLQLNVPPKIINCVNYAFNLRRDMLPLPFDLTTSALIRGFFSYYRTVKFTNQIIAPYVGKLIPFEDFSGGKFKYTAYLKQLEAMRTYARLHSHDEDRLQIEELNNQHPMIVQDPFQLNLNISRGVIITQLDYFRKCIEYGYQISMDAEIRGDAQFFEALLFDIIGNIKVEARQLQNCNGQSATLVQPHELTYSFTPTRAEIRAIRAKRMSALQSNDTELIVANDSNINIYELWTMHYIEVIYVILTQVYRIKVELLTETDDPYDPNLLERHIHHPATVSDDTYDIDQILHSTREFKEKNELVWIISCGLNTWSDRVFQRVNDQSFTSFQYAQTNKFLEQRQDNKAFAVEMFGRLSLKALENFQKLEIVLKHHQQTRDGLCKKEPLRKFFANFRVCLQNFNLKEKLQTENEFGYGM